VPRHFTATAFAVIAVLAGGTSAALAVYHVRHVAPIAQPEPKVGKVITAAPTATPTPEPSAAPTPTPQPTPLPDSVFIKGVPYTVQAPTGNWDAAHEEYCEAAAVLMVGRYYRGDKYPNDKIPPSEADAAMAQIVQYERQTWPGVLDLSLDKVGQTGNQFYNLQPTVRPATLDNVKKAIADGNPVIIPVMTHGGPGNTKISPYYSAGNVYHVIVLIGYDSQKLYSDDAGISQGQNYPYTWDVLSAAMQAQQQHMGQGSVMLTFAKTS
jgi:hypothetical protein